jgi:hypothetical protein
MMMMLLGLAGPHVSLNSVRPDAERQFLDFNKLTLSTAEL